MFPDLVPIRRALISVSDKTGLVPLASGLAARGVELLSTGGTAQALRAAGLPVRDVSEVTEFPEMLDGRVKTLHPMVHAGLLARRDLADHAAALEEYGIAPIDLLVVNLYPFEATVAAGARLRTPASRTSTSAARRCCARRRRTTASSPSSPTSRTTRPSSPSSSGTAAPPRSPSAAPRRSPPSAARRPTTRRSPAGWPGRSRRPRRGGGASPGTLAQPLRYGENPHQGAAFYRDGSARPGVATARQLQGKALSYNNINDTDAAFELVAEFAPADGPACAIIKHANPCGVARGASLLEAYRAAYDCDRTSAFGGIVALNGTLDAETAAAIAEIFTEVVIAPEVDRGGGGGLRGEEEPPPPRHRRPARRPRTPAWPGGRSPAASWSRAATTAGSIRPPSGSSPAARPTRGRARRPALRLDGGQARQVERHRLRQGRRHGRHRRGADEPGRLDPHRRPQGARHGRGARPRRAADRGARWSPRTPSSPSPTASSPPPRPGATAVIQPGGSVRDEEVIAAADAAGLAMVFTGMRHFRH